MSEERLRWDGAYQFIQAPPTPEATLTGLRLFVKYRKLYGMQIAFGGVWGPVLGGGGNGTLAFELNTTAGEALTGAVLLADTRAVYGATLHTSSGRVVSIGDRVSSGADVVGSPCPMGAYQLVSIRGWVLMPYTTQPSFPQLSLTWRLVPSTGAALIAAAQAEVQGAGWQCVFGLASVIRKGPATGAPECLTAAGQSACLQGDCRALQLCAAVGPGPALQLPGQQRPGQLFGRRGCSGAASPADNSSDYRSPQQWCSRAAGLLGLSPGPPAPVPIRVITLILSICDSWPTASVSDIEQSWYNDPYGLQSYWKAASWGQAVFNRSTSVIKHVQLPCGAVSPATNCQYYEWQEYIFRQASALGVPEPRGHVDNRIRRQLSSSLMTPSYGIHLAVWKRTMGMSLGLMTSGRGNWSSPYPWQAEEASDPLQYNPTCQRCLHIAPHQLQLGWATPLATLTAAQLPPGVPTAPIRLPAFAAAKQSPVVIYLDWLDGYGAVRMIESYDTPQVAPYNGTVLVLSYRLRMGQDEGISDEFHDAVSVHRASLLLGATLDGTRVGGSPWLAAVVPKGGRTVLGEVKLVVGVAPPTPGAPSVAVVSVCRFGGTPAECGVV
ncbi:hypothetical protein HYH03_011329 [Edaphochlamys debaryana]|uniref:Uncharacterized protein n=1 Tax=Edaphochlamys debaryana TaxID=47281 RepID=A0A835XS60_9CHLO|nr:hypothetical protein HYH03_011329 [Edaphochlamys debaryana]|eukprot:KAG2490202.1 hypothetical protein HYH03_011329 [Edaphochlamys debaryana]